MAEVDLAELERYLRIFQENPDSRVFAPLADLYRRLGRLKEAEEIVREGMERHPYYAGGRVAFAHVLLDSERLEEALQEAEQVVTYYPDNLLARKILIRVLGGLNQLERARREFEALKALAPQIASDPELERALQGPQSIRKMPLNPGLRRVPDVSAERPDPVLPNISAEITLESEEMQSSRENFNELQGVGVWGNALSLGLEPEAELQPHRSFRLKKLLRKKMLLETWLRVLGENPSLR